jgi:ActR/RegA family two-component response regulator
MASVILPHHLGANVDHGRAGEMPMTAKDRARSLLIVDDDIGFAESVSRALEPEGIAALCVNTPERAVAALRDPPEGWEPASVAVIDLHACGDFGMDLIRQLQIERPGLICVVMMAGIY